MQIWLIASNYPLGNIFPAEPGTKNFSILLGVSLGAMFIFGKMIAASVSGSKCGWASGFFGIIVPVVILFVGLKAVDFYLLEKINPGILHMTAKFGSGLILLLFGSLVSGKILLRVSMGKSLLAVVLTCAASYACVYVGSFALESFSAGSDKAKSYRQRWE